MREDAHVVFVGLVDDGAIKIRREFLYRAAAVVDPDLDHVGLLARELLHVGARFGFCRDSIGGIAHGPAGTGVGHAEAASRRQISRARPALIAHPIRKVAPRGSGFHHRHHAVIGEAVENVGQVFPRVIVGAEIEPAPVAHMNMGIDKGWHYRFAGKVYARGAGGKGNRTFSSDLSDSSVLHDEGGNVDYAAVAGNQSRTFVKRDALTPRRGHACKCRNQNCE